MGEVLRTCDRAREWISADLDGELSELECALLRAHLAGCIYCAAQVRGLADATVRLRFAALDRGDVPQFTVPRRRRLSLRAVQAGAAAFAVAGVAGLGALLPTPGGPTAAAPKPEQSRILGATDRKLQELGRTYLQQPSPGPARAQ